MTKTRVFVVATLLAATLSGCWFRAARPCRTECWWDHGRRVCEKRCR
jgi:hypothetical protein